MNKVYSKDGEFYYDRFPNDMEVGDIYYEADKVHITPEQCVTEYSINGFLEDLDCSLYNRVNAEDMDSCFQVVRQDDKQELLNLVQQWVKKHVYIPYWNVANVVEKFATEADI